MNTIDHSYALLREAAEQKGFFKKKPRYYITHILFSLGMIVSGFFLLWLFEHIVLQIGAIIILSIGFVQASLTGHDIAHHQVFRSQYVFALFGTLYWNLLLGASFRYWTTKHDRHHANPNQLGKDPDLEAPFVFSEEQALGANRFMQWLAKYQKMYFFFVLALGYVSVAGSSVIFLARQKITRTITAEWFLYILHYALYFSFFSSFLSLERVILLTFLHYATMGIYLGMIFAPNHKGLRVFGEHEVVPFAYRQIVTSRNIRPSMLTDFLYGGLNYQIEHHLFPTMPRSNLRHVRELVLPFCEQRGITYEETTFIGSFRSIYENFVTHAPAADAS